MNPNSSSKHPDYERHYADWSRTLPNASHEVIHGQVMKHLAFKDQVQAAKPQMTSPCQFVPSPAPRNPWEWRAIVVLLGLILLSLLAKIAHGEPAPPLPLPFSHVMMLPQAGSVPIPLPIQGSGSSSPVYVICSSGCSAAGAFADNSAFTVGTTPGSILFGYYTSGSAPTLTSGSAARARIDSSSYLFVDCAVGCAGGSFNNNSDAVATSSTNGQSAAWLYGFNGTTFDRLRVDGSKNLEVNINASSATVPVSGTFWQTTQPVSGTFWQTTQPVSAASLPLPTGASTAAKQPALGTAGSASADVITVQGIASMTALKVDGSGVTQPVSGSVTVTQATGTNLHAVLDTTSTTAVTQATASNLNAAVVGVGSAGSASGGVLTVQGVASMTKLLVTPDSVALPANQSVNENQIGGTGVVANPCQEAIPTTVAISQTANTKIISAASSKKNYICSIILIAGAAEIPSIVEGTGSTCGTSTAAVMGSTTTANGLSLAANGGFAFGNGVAAVVPGIGTNVDTCLYQNGSNRLAGMISYVQE